MDFRVTRLLSSLSRYLSVSLVVRRLILLYQRENSPLSVSVAFFFRVSPRSVFNSLLQTTRRRQDTTLHCPSPPPQQRARLELLIRNHATDNSILNIVQRLDNAVSFPPYYPRHRREISLPVVCFLPINTCPGSMECTSERLSLSVLLSRNRPRALSRYVIGQD